MKILNLKYLFDGLKNILRQLYVLYSKPINIYANKSSKKRVLVSYLKSPFYLKNRPIKHANVIECRSIAKIFRNLGYTVDVVDWRCKRNIRYQDYDVIFGFGLPFRRSFEKDHNIKKICYLAGSSPNFSNTNEAKRIRDIFQNKGVLLEPRREVYWKWMHVAINSDLLIVGGNKETASTYLDYVSNIETIPIPAIPLQKTIQSDSIEKGILWFGGAGAVHKGLDLVLEGLSKFDKEFSLDVCGPIENELDFLNLYEQHFKSKQVNFHGMIDPSSKQMEEIVKRNSFIILPSCSEGMPSSVSTCMQLGLIPIVTKECGFDTNDKFAIEIEDLTISSVKNSIEKALKLEDDKILDMKNEAIKYAKKIHSKQNYEDRLLEILLEFENSYFKETRY